MRSKTIQSATVLLLFLLVCVACRLGSEQPLSEQSCAGPIVPNTHVERPVSETRLFVFIHGWGGTKDEETWGCFISLMKNDKRLSGYAVQSYGYPSSLVGHSPSIEDIAGNLEQWLMNCCANFQSYVLVGHSLGGLVVKEYILNVLRRGQAAQLKVDLLFLIATPNTGADLARWASFVPTIRSAQLSALSGAGDRFLSDQQRYWNHHVEGADWRLHPSQKKWIKPIIIYGTDDHIVAKESARDRFPLAIPVFRGHADIVKPQKDDDEVFQTLVTQTLNAFSNDLEPSK